MRVSRTSVMRLRTQVKPEPGTSVLDRVKGKKISKQKRVDQGNLVIKKSKDPNKGRGLYTKKEIKTDGFSRSFPGARSTPENFHLEKTK